MWRVPCDSVFQAHKQVFRRSRPGRSLLARVRVPFCGSLCDYRNLTGWRWARMFHRAGNFPFQFVRVCLYDLVCAKICTTVTIFICSAMRVKIDFFETPTLPAPALLPRRKVRPLKYTVNKFQWQLQNFFLKKPCLKTILKNILINLSTTNLVCTPAK